MHWVLRGRSSAHSLALDQSYVWSENYYRYRQIKMEREKEECNRGPEVQSSIPSKNTLKFMSWECGVGPEGQRWLEGWMEYDSWGRRHQLWAESLALFANMSTPCFLENLGPGTDASRDYGVSSSSWWKVGMGAYMQQLVMTVAKTIKELETFGDLAKM